MELIGLSGVFTLQTSFLARQITVGNMKDISYPYGIYLPLLRKRKIPRYPVWLPCNESVWNSKIRDLPDE